MTEIYLFIYFVMEQSFGIITKECTEKLDEEIKEIDRRR